MFNFIKGFIYHLSPDEKMLKIAYAQECELGYQIYISSQSPLNLLPEGTLVELYLYTHQTAEQQLLYGFQSLAEKNMFLQLISVSGIGPKLGLGILSQVSLNQLALAISTQDFALLEGLSGIGKKTAARMVVELKDKMVWHDYQPEKEIPHPKPQTSSAKKSADSQSVASLQLLKDLQSALLGLGFALPHIQAIIPQLPLTQKNLTIESAITLALSLLSKNKTETMSL